VYVDFPTANTLTSNLSWYILRKSGHNQNLKLKLNIFITVTTII